MLPHLGVGDPLVMCEPSELERELHESLAPWAAEHSQRYQDIATLPYDPRRFKSQQIRHGVTRTRFESADARISGLERLLSESFGSALGVNPARVREALAPVAGSLRSRLRSGQSVVLVTAHADALHDVGVFCGGLAITLRDASLIRRNGAILNKVMTRETFRGAPIEKLFALFGNVYWVIPETPSADRWGIPHAARSYVNTAAMRAVVKDMRRGIVLTIAPSGSVIHRSADSGEDSLEIPPVGASTASLVARFDAYLPAVMWGGDVLVGPVSPTKSTPLTDRSRRKRLEESLMNSIMEDLAAMATDAAGTPVRYRGTRS